MIDNDTVRPGRRSPTPTTPAQPGRRCSADASRRTSSAATAAIVGQTVQFNGIDFAVVGLLSAKGSTGPQDQDDRVIAPLTAVQDTLSGYGTLSASP